MSYRQFLRQDKSLLVFGLMLTGFSCFGQTFFISLFGNEIRSEFDLTSGAYGLLYGAATIASALTLSWLGSFIDRVDLRVYAVAVALGLMGACALMASSQSLLRLTLALYGLRLFGQGLMSHTSITTIGRYFDQNRGKALSVASLGFPLGEAILPSLVALSVVYGTWRQTWLEAGIAVLVLGIPGIFILLRGHHQRHTRFTQHLSAKQDGESSPTREFSKRDVIRDPNFYLLLPLVMGPPFLVTGLFFHHTILLEEKNWSEGWFATCFIAYASSQWPSSLIAGPLVDRFGAVRLLPFYLAPLALGFGILLGVDHRLGGLLFMATAGVTSGLIATIGGALWAEIYGVLHLGSIRALSTSAMVVSTAISPALFGWCLDAGTGFDVIHIAAILFIIASVLLGRLALAHKDFGSDGSTS